MTCTYTEVDNQKNKATLSIIHIHINERKINTVHSICTFTCTFLHVYVHISESQIRLYNHLKKRKYYEINKTRKLYKKTSASLCERQQKWPERRKAWEQLRWNHRDLVASKTKEAERRSERESGLTLSATLQLEGVCVCACASKCASVCLLVEFRCCICASAHPCLLILVYLLAAMRAR